MIVIDGLREPNHISGNTRWPKSKTDRDEEDAILEVYLHALGMLDDDADGEAPPTMMAAE